MIARIYLAKQMVFVVFYGNKSMEINLRLLKVYTFCIFYGSTEGTKRKDYISLQDLGPPAAQVRKWHVAVVVLQTTILPANVQRLILLHPAQPKS